MPELGFTERTPESTEGESLAISSPDFVGWSSGLPRPELVFVTREEVLTGSALASVIFHAVALSNRTSELSVTRRLNRGLVLKVRNVSSQIFAWADEGPRRVSSRYASVDMGAAFKRMSHAYIRTCDCRCVQHGVFRSAQD